MLQEVATFASPPSPNPAINVESLALRREFLVDCILDDSVRNSVEARVLNLLVDSREQRRKLRRLSMHSAILRGDDFVIQSNGQTVRHADFFSGFTIGTRLGLITPNGLDGIGAANLVLGYVTAFYDRHRENSDQFHAYPEFRAFQCGSRIADYGMLDIYPTEKNIRTKSKPESVLYAVIEQKINILLIPSTNSGQSKVQNELIKSVQETVHTCFLYSSGGEVAHSNITIECHKPEIFDWIKAVANSMPDNKPDDHVSNPTPPSLKQSYLEVSLESALKYL